MTPNFPLSSRFVSKLPQQVLEEALLPFLSGFPTSRLKLITMYIEQRRARDQRAVLANEKNNNLFGAVDSRSGGVAGGKVVLSGTPMSVP